jgi:hypothetical protein
MLQVGATGIVEEKIDISTTLYALISWGFISIAQGKIYLTLIVKGNISKNNIACDRMIRMTVNNDKNNTS